MKVNLQAFYDECIKMKGLYAAEVRQDQGDQIVKDFVSHLRDRGLSDEEIQEVLNIELLTEAQGNRRMLSNDAAYRAAVKKALGSK